MQKLPLTSQTIKQSLTVINQVINELINQSKHQAISNKMISRFMNPFTSQKVNSTINEIGNLIYEEAQDSQAEMRFKHFAQVESPKYFDKDNMFTNGVVVDQHQERQLSKFNKDQRQSVQSFQASLSKLPVNLQITQNWQKNHELVNSSITVPSKQRRQTLSNYNRLVSLQPQSSNQNRTSAFTQSQSQHLQQKMMEIQINDYRQQKVLEQQNRKKTIQKQKKMTNLLSNDQVIMTFDYSGDFIKKNKRQLAQLINNKNNQKIVETGLSIKDPQKFWKSKNNKNSNQLLNTSSSSFTANNSNINQLKSMSLKLKDSLQKKTNIEKLQELKKKSILVQLKKKISLIQQKTIDKKTNRLNSLITIGLNGQKLSEQEQAKIKQHHMEFLSQNLNTYHQNQLNFMPEWVQTVEKGCKMTIFIGDGEHEDRDRDKQRQRNVQKKSHRSLSDKSEKTSKMNQNLQRQIKSPKKSKNNGFLGNLHEVKHIQNLKIKQLTQGEIVEEWQKRIYIKSLDNKPNLTNGRKRSSNLKNSRTISVQQNKQLNRKNININEKFQDQTDRVSQSYEINNQNSNSPQRKPSDACIRSKKYENSQEEDAKSQYSFSNVQTQPKTKLNLNKKQFQKLKIYLKNKNSIVTRNQTIKKDSMEFFLMSRQNQPKPSQIINSSENKHKKSVFNQSIHTQPHNESKYKQNAQSINQQEEQSTTNQKRLSQKHRRLLTLAWKPRSFSVNERKSSPSKSQAQTKGNVKLDGQIRINNQKLKHSLLRDTIDFDLSRSSILNTNNRSKSNLKSSSSEIKWELTQKSKLKSIRKSEKRLSSTESQKNSSKLVQIPQNINFHEVSLSRAVGKQTPKTQSTWILVNKPRKSIAKTNLLKSVAK